MKQPNFGWSYPPGCSGVPDDYKEERKHTMDITIQTIEHADQRYETVGDWQFQPTGDLKIKVSDLGDWRLNALVGVHELVEALLAKDLNVSEFKVDQFDMEYEKNRKEGDISEAGDDPTCPVYWQHQIATIIERLLCYEFGIDWAEYDMRVLQLGKEKE